MKVFGVTLLATQSFSDHNVIHVETITAEFLDNNEDGVPDDMLTNTSVANRYGAMLLAGSESDEEMARTRAGNVESSGRIGHIQNMARQYEHETSSGGTLCGSACGTTTDVSLEEILHLIQKGGYVFAHPDVSPGNPRHRDRTVSSLLTEAMDIAREGCQPRSATVYPDSAWYHFVCPECGYYDQGVDYCYWGLTTLLGAQGDLHPARCPMLQDEWEACDKAKLQAMDVKLYALLTNPACNLPTRLPDGRYR